MKPATASTETLSAAQQACPIVGIGASAGGLQAPQELLGHVPAHCGAAFVAVQHLDPAQKDLMAELLQRKTSVRVSQITDRMPVEPGQVYVIAPNRELSILHGVLYLLEPAEPRGLRLPIDAFLRSLADDQQAQGIAVILSGMGTGLADVVAPAQELGVTIDAYLKHRPTLTSRTDHTPVEVEQSDFEAIIPILPSQRPGVTFHSTRRARFTGALNGAWACTSSSESPITFVTCAATPGNPSFSSRTCSLG